MTTDQYLADLRNAVRSLPPEEAQQAVDYYGEYLRDADDPAAAMAELGTPKEVASQILAGYVGKTSSRPTIGVLWAVILGILAAPIAAPLAITVFAVVLAVVIALAAVVLSLLATAGGLLFGGACSVVTGFAIIGQSFTTFAWMVGGGLLCCAVGLIGGYGIIKLCRVIVAILARWVVGIINRFKRGNQS